MNKKQAEDFKMRYKKEKDLRVSRRMLAVKMVCIDKQSIVFTANTLYQCENWVSLWVKRFEEGGIDALQDKPRSGRPPIVPKTDVDNVIKNMDSRITPVIVQETLRKKLKHKFHISYIRKILHRLNMTPKVSESVHVNHSSKSAVRSWQSRMKKKDPCLEKKGFLTVFEDEAFVNHDVKHGKKYWSKKGTKIKIPYTGSHKKIAIHGAVTSDGRQFFRQYDKFNSSTFLDYVKKMHRHFGKIHIICDKASPHRSKMLKEYIKQNPNIKISYLPKGSPYLNVVEQCWNVGKKAFVVSKYYNTFEDFCKAITNYFKTKRFRYDPFKFLYRSPDKFLKNL